MPFFKGKQSFRNACFRPRLPQIPTNQCVGNRANFGLILNRNGCLGKQLTFTASPAGQMQPSWVKYKCYCVVNRRRKSYPNIPLCYYVWNDYPNSSICPEAGDLKGRFAKGHRCTLSPSWRVNLCKEEKQFNARQRMVLKTCFLSAGIWVFKKGNI